MNNQLANWTKRIFNAPKGEYLKTKKRLEKNGWKIIDEKLSYAYNDWILKCVKNDWFESLSDESKLIIRRNGTC